MATYCGNNPILGPILTSNEGGVSDALFADCAGEHNTTSIHSSPRTQVNVVAHLRVNLFPICTFSSELEIGVSVQFFEMVGLEL